MLYGILNNIKDVAILMLLLVPNISKIIKFLKKDVNTINYINYMLSYQDPNHHMTFLKNLQCNGAHFGKKDMEIIIKVVINTMTISWETLHNVINN